MGRIEKMVANEAIGSGAGARACEDTNKWPTNFLLFLINHGWTQASQKTALGRTLELVEANKRCRPIVRVVTYNTFKLGVYT